MKKLFALAATALFIMTSCSSDDSTNPGTNPNLGLLKKLIETYDDGSSFTTDFNYNGNKLVSEVDSDGWETIYTYTGELVTEMKTYEDETLFQTNMFTYDPNNKLATHLMLLHTQNSGYKSEYTHNADGTITVENFHGDLNNQTTPIGTYIVTMSNNNVTEIDMGTATQTFTYTNTIDPYSLIAGNEWMAVAFAEGGGVNNMATWHYENTMGTVYNDATFTYTYNAANLPVTSVETDAVTGDVVTTQFFYE